MDSRRAPTSVMMEPFRYPSFVFSRGDRPMAPRILVVDDEPMVRALIARALSDEGYEVVAVANGRAALDAAQGAEIGFDLIITNNYMPGLNGPELVARVRQDFPSLPILHIDDISRKRIDKGLPDDVPTVYKPFSIATLREAVRTLLTGGH
jgi:CheY-like chemotaxis protein